MALASTMSDLKSLVLQDMGDDDQTNYTDAKLLRYFNRVIRSISEEVAKWSRNFGVETYDFSFADPGGGAPIPHLMDLPTDWMQYALDDERLPRVFLLNGTDAATRLYEADEYELDGWLHETEDDADTPTRFYISGFQLGLHPRPDEAVTIRMLYYPTRTVDALTEAPPWNGLFNDILVSGVVAQFHKLSEQWGHSDWDLTQFNEDMAKVRKQIYGRKKMQLSPRGHGWNCTRTSRTFTLKEKIY